MSAGGTSETTCSMRWSRTRSDPIGSLVGIVIRWRFLPLVLRGSLRERRPAGFVAVLRPEGRGTGRLAKSPVPARTPADARVGARVRDGRAKALHLRHL